jgi:hypothetical protein
MPATAAIDNETLDHLLSVVDDGLNIAPPQRFGRRAFVTGCAEGKTWMRGASPRMTDDRAYLTSSRIA